MLDSGDALGVICVFFTIIIGQLICIDRKITKVLIDNKGLWRAHNEVRKRLGLEPVKSLIQD